mmetsp:Transcript_69156/g.109149  ORF Transcript_69156/g.109149 Transcript_69156/m.109149 type:complete len:270 (+) Transcript_69156:125-934(+)
MVSDSCQRCCNAGHPSPGLAVVHLWLCPEVDLKHLSIVGILQSILNCLSALLLLDVLDLLCCEGEHLLSCWMESGNPAVARSIFKFAAQIQTRSNLALLLAHGAEFVLIHPTIAWQHPSLHAFLHFQARSVVERLHFIPLACLYGRKAAIYGISLLLCNNLFACLLHLQNIQDFARHSRTRTSSSLGDESQILGVAAGFPPLQHPLCFWEVRMQIQFAALSQRAAKASLPLLDHDALHGNNWTATEGRIILFSTFCPKCDGHAHATVIC